jgi:hypothetical protein
VIDALLALGSTTGLEIRPTDREKEKRINVEITFQSFIGANKSFIYKSKYSSSYMSQQQDVGQISLD